MGRPQIDTLKNGRIIPRLLVQEETFWKKRAKMHWLKDKDMNTKFFQMTAVSRSKVKRRGDYESGRHVRCG